MSLSHSSFEQWTNVVTSRIMDCHLPFLDCSLQPSFLDMAPPMPMISQLFKLWIFGPLKKQNLFGGYRWQSIAELFSLRDTEMDFSAQYPVHSEQSQAVQFSLLLHSCLPWREKSPHGTPHHGGDPYLGFGVENLSLSERTSPEISFGYKTI